jgi:hypothetical protein
MKRRNAFVYGSILSVATLWGTATLAQSTPSSPSLSSPSPSEHPALSKQSTTAVQTNSSYFSGYKPQQEVKVGNWRDANDQVGRIGGWRVYTREAAEALEAEMKAEKDAKTQRQNNQGGRAHGHRH